MDLRSLLPSFERHLSARAVAARTAASYTRTVDAFLRVLGDRAPSALIVEDFLARTSARGRPLASSTKRAELMGLRAFFRFVARDGAALDPTHGIVVKRDRRDRPGAVVMPDEIAPIFEAASRSAEPIRNAAILALLFVLGLRVHEVVALDVAQVDLGARVLRNVRGKGGTVTQFPIPEELGAILAPWLRVRPMTSESSAVLFPTARPSTSPGGRLSVRSIQRLVASLARAAGLARAVGPHALRHACGTAAIRLGIDVKTTSILMRHANVATTSIYLHVADDERAEPIARLAAMIPASRVPTSEHPPNGGSELDDARRGDADAPKNTGQNGLDVHPV